VCRLLVGGGVGVLCLLRLLVHRVVLSCGRLQMIIASTGVSGAKRELPSGSSMYAAAETEAAKSALPWRRATQALPSLTSARKKQRRASGLRTSFLRTRR